MSFRLLIECSKDIDELHINFSDGTSSVVQKEPERKNSELKELSEYASKKSTSGEQKIAKEPRKKLDTYLDTEEDYTIQQEVVLKPIIQEVQRPAKVSEELQNLDI